MRIGGRVVGVLFDNQDFGFSDDLAVALLNVDAVTGLLLMASAITVCTTPAVDVVPVLRTAVTAVSLAVAALGVLAIMQAVTERSPTALSGVRLEPIFTRSGPAVMMGLTAAWLARRVQPFPA